MNWEKWLKRREQLAEVSSLFLVTIKALDPALCDKEEMCGRWPVKAMVSHINGWEIEVAKRFKEFLAGPVSDKDYKIDEFNRHSVEARRHLAWSDVVEELESSQEDLLQIIDSLSADHLQREKRFQKWINVLISHYRHHLKQLKNTFS